MNHELSAHEMRHQFSISQAHISGHKQTKLSHHKLSGKSETESSLHQADFLRVRYWPAPARVLWEGQDAFSPPNLQSCMAPWSSPTAVVQQTWWRLGKVLFHTTATSALVNLRGRAWFSRLSCVILPLWPKDIVCNMMLMTIQHTP